MTNYALLDIKWIWAIDLLIFLIVGWLHDEGGFFTYIGKEAKPDSKIIIYLMISFPIKMVSIIN